MRRRKRATRAARSGKCPPRNDIRAKRLARDNLVDRLRWTGPERKDSMIKSLRRLLPLFVLAVPCLLLTAAAAAQCNIQLSEQGVLHLKSGEQRTVTWNSVPG